MIDPCKDCIKADEKAVKMNELIRKIELILIEEGQHDTEKFRLGETIRYAPYEVTEILKVHIDELRDSLT